MICVIRGTGTDPHVIVYYVGMRSRQTTYAVLLAAALALPAAVVQSRGQAPDVFRATDAPTNAVWVDGLDLSRAPIRRPRAQRGQPPPAPLKLNLGGVEYPHGVPLQVNADLVIDLRGGAKRFGSMVGIDDERKNGQGSVTFDVWVDGKQR